MDDAKEMNAGVVLLLERMKTHPEEFLDMHTYSKWGKIIADEQNYLEPEDQEALKQGINALHQQRFAELVMEELVDPKPEKNPYLMSNTATGGATLGRSSVTLNNTNTITNVGTATWGNTATTGLTIGSQTLDEKTIEHLKAHVEYTKRQRELETHKAKQVQKTLIGRLKNYLHNE